MESKILNPAKMPKRIMNELKEFQAQAEELQSEFVPVGEDYFKYLATIPGPEGTCYEGKKFELDY